MTWLFEPFAYDYLLRALWVCLLVGVVTGMLSAFLVLKGWSLMGDALAHAIIPGVALAYLLALPFAVGAFFAALLAALSISLVQQTTRLKQDVAIGLVFTGFLSLGLILASLYPISINLQAIILGNVLAISIQDAWQVLAIVVLTILLVAYYWRALTLLFFDMAQARVIGLSVMRLQLLFFALLSAVCVVALQTVGALLVIAMLITPGATAYLLCNKLLRMSLISSVIGAITACSGVYVSYFLDFPPGAVVVLLQTLLFIAVFLLSSKGYGLMLWRHRRGLHG